MWHLSVLEVGKGHTHGYVWLSIKSEEFFPLKFVTFGVCFWILLFVCFVPESDRGQREAEAMVHADTEFLLGTGCLSSLFFSSTFLPFFLSFILLSFSGSHTLICHNIAQANLKHTSILLYQPPISWGCRLKPPGKVLEYFFFTCLSETRVSLCRPGLLWTHRYQPATWQD